MERRAKRVEIDQIAWNTIKTAKINSTAFFQKSGILPIEIGDSPIGMYEILRPR
jgi:hypothetical protein